MTRAFTLIETLLYIGLMSFLMTGMLASAFAISGSADRNRTEALLSQEGLFLMQAIRWGLQGAEIVSASGDRLVAEAAGEVRTFAIEDGLLHITDGSGTYALSPYAAEGFAVRRSGIVGNAEDPAQVEIVLILSAPARGIPVVRTFRDTIYEDAP